MATFRRDSTGTLAAATVAVGVFVACGLAVAVAVVVGRGVSPGAKVGVDVVVAAGLVAVGVGDGVASSPQAVISTILTS
jgi:hypothetical protein